LTALATTDGFAHSYSGSYYSLSVAVLAGQDEGMERDYDYSSARHFADLASPEAIGKSAAERTLKRLNPKQAPTSNLPIVFDPRVSRGLLNYFAGAISGSAVARKTSFLKDTLGKEIFAPSITIMDDPHRPRGLSSKPYDAEGVAAKKRAFIEKGGLTSWLLDSRSARQLGMHSTGHASRGLSSPPSPSATNLYMEPGSLTPQALMADIKQGLYVTETQGMGVNLITGDYSQGAAGFWIENGQITYPVSEVTIAGHLNDMFKQMTPANDLEFRYSVNAPTLRIEKMMVAGKS
jgi:PmbA protein